MRERNIEQLPLSTHPSQGSASNSRTRPVRGLNQQPFALRNSAQPSEPHGRGLSVNS